MPDRKKHKKGTKQKKHTKEKDGVPKTPKKHARLSIAAEINFQKMLDEADLDGDGEIDLEELRIAMDSQTFTWENVYRHLGSIGAALGLLVFFCACAAVSIRGGDVVGEYFVQPEVVKYKIGAFKSDYPLQEDRGEGGTNPAQITNTQARAMVAMMQTCDDLEYDGTDKCINSMLIRFGVKQGFAITGLICGLVGALTSWSRKPCFRKVSACTVGTACFSWLVVFAILITYVNTEGFQAYYINQVFGKGEAGCGFKGFGPTPQLVEFGPSYTLYIWAFVGSLIGFALKMLDIFKGPSQHAHKVGPSTDELIEDLIQEGIDEADEDAYSSDGGEGGNRPPPSPHPTKIPSFNPPSTGSKKPKDLVKPTKEVLQQQANTTATGVGDLMAPRMTFGPPGASAGKQKRKSSETHPFPAADDAQTSDSLFDGTNQPDFSVTRQGTSNADGTDFSVTRQGTSDA